MQKYLYIIGFLLLWGCSDFLTVDDPTQISNEEVLTDLDNANLAAVGLYNQLVTEQTLFREFYLIYPELMAGNLKPNPDLNLTVNEIDRYLRMYQFNAAADDGGILGSLYGDHYALIMAATNLIEQLPSIDDSRSALKNAILSEAYTMRALAYFYLLQWYAQDYNFSESADHPAVPILRNQDDLFAARSRSTVREVYRYIEEDLNNALELWTDATIRSSDTRIWIQKDAIWGLLSRVYLYQSKYQEAIEAADSCISATNLNLLSPQSLGLDWMNQELSESLWKLSSNFVLSTGVNAMYGSGILGQDQEFVITEDIRDLYDGGDLRFSELMIRNALGDWSTGKYPFVPNTTEIKAVIRLSEVYLNRAEAHIRLSQFQQAKQDLQLIIDQAGGWMDVEELSDADLFDFLMEERRRELVFEGHVFSDIKRWQQSVLRVDYPVALINAEMNYPSDFYVLPIPLNAIIQNPSLVQNPSY